MKIKIVDPSLTITLQAPKMVLKPDSVYEIDDTLAKKLIEASLAIEVTE